MFLNFENSELQLVPYDPKYQPSFASLVNDSHSEFGFALNPSLDQDLSQPEAFYRNIWVLVYDDKVVGSVALKSDTIDEVVLKRMYLRPPFRGKGFGNLLLRTALAEAKEAGFHKITLDTNRKQLSAQRTYEAAGFKLTKEDGEVMFYELDLSSRDV
ncbi:GNAT family N-acetyltransferase [Candidatus Saccharibacteria bacterium]|nr:MAG: GNAT family N-acetyltransferase [Candidatus Saccharibacteria bacterium]